MQLLLQLECRLLTVEKYIYYNIIEVIALMSSLLSKKYSLKKGLLIQKFDKETIIYDAEEAKIHILNSVAAFILHRLRTKNNITQIADSLVQKYQVKRERAEKDTSIFIKNLIGNKLIIYCN